MPTPVKMPRLGESVAEGTIGSWIKQEGDYIDRDEALAEVVTDKINAELPSPVAGRLIKILVNVDETVPVGTDIALIEESADIASVGQEQAPTGGTSADVANGGRGQAHAPTGDASADVASGRGQSLAPTEQLQNGGYVTSGANSSLTNGSALKTEEEERQRISPLASPLAREHGINLHEPTC